jgi:hypothetical protein
LKRWIPFLIVNIIVSALTTLLVLTLWNKFNTGNAIEVDTPTTMNQPSQVEQTEIILPPLDVPVINIANVFAAGDLSNELMVVERIGEGALNLVGWQIIDQDNNTFTFPAIELVKGQISIYTRSGTDTVNTLFWGSETPIWSTGETVKILDSAGQVRAEFEIP